MSDRDDDLPPLSDDVRAAMAAFRAVRPSPALADRVSAALADPAAPARAPTALARRSDRRRAALRSVAVVGLASAAAVGVALAVARYEAPALTAHAPPAPRHVAVRLADREAAWVHLPWTIQEHRADEIRVHFEAPARMTFHTPHAPTPAHRATRCAGERCEHRWVASTRAGRHGHLRVEIAAPGRYEFRVTHASRHRRVSEHFVVLATR